MTIKKRLMSAAMKKAGIKPYVVVAGRHELYEADTEQEAQEMLEARRLADYYQNQPQKRY